MSTATVSNLKIQFQNQTERTVYATWSWSKAHTDHFSVKWEYDTGNGIWFVPDSPKSTSNHQDIYSVPENAIRVRVKVTPVAKNKPSKNKKKKNKAKYWNASTKTSNPFTITSDPRVLQPPGAPSVTISSDFKLTASVVMHNTPAEDVEFEIVRDDNTVLFPTQVAKLVTETASITVTVAPGSNYKVRARAGEAYSYAHKVVQYYGDGSNYGKKSIDETGKVTVHYTSRTVASGGAVSSSAGHWSDWSEYSENVFTVPDNLGEIIEYRAESENSVYLKWNPQPVASKYTVQYTKNADYFGSNPSEVQTAETEDGNPDVDHILITGISSEEGGEIWYFRARAVNGSGESAWTPIVFVGLGSTADPPTTWAYNTTITVGDDIVMNWVHNASDGSAQKTYTVKYVITQAGGEAGEPKYYYGSGTDQQYILPGDLEDENHNRLLNDGTTVTWSVATSGANEKLSEYSTERVFYVYAPAVASIGLYSDETAETPMAGLTTLPAYLKIDVTPSSQIAIAYAVDIVSHGDYDTVDQEGSSKHIMDGDVIYSNVLYSDYEDNTIIIPLTAGMLDLQDGIVYEVKCSVALDTGLSADETFRFLVDWDSVDMSPDANVYIDQMNWIAYIQPFCYNDEYEQITDVLFNVYRRDSDGGLIELMTGVDGAAGTTIVDPHPSLDYARYRIVAISKATGKAVFYDLPGEEVGCGSIIMQWNETWVPFDNDDETELSDQPYSGSSLQLPYNIDVSEDHSPDTELVNYIGRQYPVSYYGTQKGVTARWKVDIPKSDVETIYQVRRLSAYMGDVYIREPSGTGYWANVKVSYNIDHKKKVVPVTFSVTRVEGGA